MQTALFIILIISAVGMVIFILLQQSKGAEMGSSFGGGGSDTVFGAVGTMSIFAKITTVLAVIFFVTSLSLAYMARQQINLGADNSDFDLGIIDGIETTELNSAPTDSELGSDELNSGVEVPATNAPILEAISDDDELQ